MFSFLNYSNLQVQESSLKQQILKEILENIL